MLNTLKAQNTCLTAFSLNNTFGSMPSNLGSASTTFNSNTTETWFVFTSPNNAGKLSGYLQYQIPISGLTIELLQANCASAATAPDFISNQSQAWFSTPSNPYYMISFNYFGNLQANTIYYFKDKT